MTQQHPITPPPELVQQWVDSYFGGRISQSEFHKDLATRAAQWGADQELEACLEWLEVPELNVDTYKLRTTRRPQPPSLAEQALSALEMHFAAIGEGQCHQPAHKITIRRALERLQKLEEQQ